MTQEARIESSRSQAISTFLTTHSSKIAVAVGIIIALGALLIAWQLPGLHANTRLGIGMGGGIVGFIIFMTGAAVLCENSGIDQMIMGSSRYENDSMSRYNFLSEFFPHAVSQADQAIKNGLSQVQERTFGSLMGGACGDAAGAPLEFHDYRQGPWIDEETFDMTPGAFEGVVSINGHYRRCQCKPGQWTDDASMMLCLADAALKPDGIDKSGNLNQVDLMHRFKKWWERGYNNAFGNDDHRTHKCSVGLGGNISESFHDPLLPAEESGERTFATQAGNKHVSGNGSVMRGGVPGLIYGLDSDQVREVARQQSYTTHQGEEAAECAAFMAVLIHEMVYAPEGKSTREVFNEVIENYECSLNSVQGLIRSGDTVPNNKNPDNVENWNWKDKNFTFNPERLKEGPRLPGPGYIGSYCMDAMAMALHCIEHTDNFRDAVVMAIKNGGDADSVGAIVGQIAGAMYGYSAIPKSWRDAVGQWDNGTIIGRAYLLCQSPDQRSREPALLDEVY